MLPVRMADRLSGVERCVIEPIDRTGMAPTLLNQQLRIRTCILCSVQRFLDAFR